MQHLTATFVVKQEPIEFLRYLFSNISSDARDYTIQNIMPPLRFNQIMRLVGEITLMCDKRLLPKRKSKLFQSLNS